MCASLSKDCCWIWWGPSCPVCSIYPRFIAQGRISCICSSYRVAWGGVCPTCSFYQCFIVFDRAYPIYGSYHGFGLRFGTSAVPIEASLLEAGSNSWAFESNNPSKVWVDKEAVLHYFNPTTNKWKQQSSTCCPHYDSRLFVANNKLYVAGVSGSSLYPSASVKVYDEENNIWSVVEQKHIPPNKLDAVEVEARVYFMVKKFPVDVGIRFPPVDLFE